MTVVSYRLYCQECPNEEVIREEELEDSLWRVITLHYHEGLCPACNDAVDPDEDSGYAKCHQKVPFEDLDNIGDTGADNLREKGIVTRQDVKNVTDDEILDTPWVGEAGLKSIRQEVQ